MRDRNAIYHIRTVRIFFPIETMSPVADHDNKPCKKKYLCTIKRTKIKRSFVDEIAL